MTISIGWALLAIFVFLFFSVMPEGADSRAAWYLNTITIIETGAFLFASFLCFRNWQSSQIVSGREVWLSIGIGLLLYAAGNLFFYLWNNVFGLDPSVSFGDFFYLLSYVFLAIGMFKAVLPRRLNLDIKQWGIVAVIGILGIALAVFPSFGGEEAAIAPTASPTLSEIIGLEAPAWAQDPPPAEPVPAEPAPAEPPPAEPAPVEPPPVEPVPAEPAPAEPVPEDAAPAEPAPAEPAPAESAPVEADVSTNAPGWAVATDAFLEPFEDFVGYLYIAGDCLLLVVAATLLVAFWGGRFSQSWKLIAIAAFCLYIADMFFAYQDNYIEGAVWEVFWTFSALFFGLGAVVENAISTSSRRNPRRRRTKS
ncbi:MAG: hypothetical protein AAGD09_10540 [Cyanobacteria bacterium P01_F01_bin.56]